MRPFAGALVLVSACTLAHAADVPAGCAAAGLGAEGAMITASHEAASGAENGRTPGAALDVALQPLASAHLPVPPEHPPAGDTTAGSIAVAAGGAGRYRVSVTEPAWIDVVQGGRYLEPAQVGGVTDCGPLRKSLTVDLSAAPFVLQFSGTQATALALTLVAAP